MSEQFTVIEESELIGWESRRKNAREASVASAVALVGDVMAGRVPYYYIHEALSPRTPAMIRVLQVNYPGILRVSEAMTTSDFPLLTGDILERTLLAAFREFPSPWRQFAKVSTLRDFRQVSRIAVDGLEGQWGAIPEQGEVKYGSLEEGRIVFSALKYGHAAKFSFEALRNDDLGAFQDIPNRLGRGGRRTQNRFVTGLYVGAAGPLASLYSVGNANIVTGNPALTVDSLALAWGMLRNQRDANNEPIMVEAAVLVVPPSLEVTARNILNAQRIFRTTGGGTSGAELEVNNWLVGNISLAVDPYIEVIAASNQKTSWFLFAAPSVGRPAIEVGLLAGFEEPRLYQKAANTVTIGGGIDQAAGDFLTMDQHYKGVIAFGGTVIEPKMTVGSNGSGS